ncbi:GGDEF domain-containing protein [Sulfurimonas sp.]|uniref:bifunctional diguanylate cyclase/phosphodiesterase n=1 Tax=Sulfurimonas sp. TaxID=2022749 RepID=UPI00262181BD|nr:GGDEF domain-containing protein [Sulfurimonas sp.]
MLLPQTKEREYRFKLALRMGLPIFALVVAFIFHTFVSNYGNLTASMYIEAVLLLFVSIYFIFYLIYSGFEVKITDNITKTFTREYLYKYLIKELHNKKTYTLILLSVENLNDINKLYGIKNGDKVLREVVLWIAKYFKDADINNFPLGHLKGGDFIIGLEGKKEKYMTLLDLFCLKSNEFKVGDIEVKISGAIVDSRYSQELDYLIEHLFEIQNRKKVTKEEEINPNELESLVINAIKERNLFLMKQDVFENESLAFRECFVKLKGEDSKLIHPKTYIKVINKLSLGVDFDLLVIEEILQKSVENKIFHAINILPTSLRNDKFLFRVKEFFKEYGTLNIIFVLSEFEYYSHTQRYNSILHSLKKLGIKIAIDRLGSIHTSFLYLRELDIDIVRFDSYYSNDEKLKKNFNIVDGFVIMAHEKGVKTWIKNIQTQQSFELAKKVKVDYIQGKYLSELEQR